MHVLKQLSDTRFLEAKQIVLVQDNLNTHTPASLYEAFSVDEARRLVERFESTGLNMAAGSTWLSPNWVSSFPKSPDARQALPQERGCCLGGQSRQETHQSQLAFHDSERACQTSETPRASSWKA
jgi:hypothetical protein